MHDPFGFEMPIILFRFAPADQISGPVQKGDQQGPDDAVRRTAVAVRVDKLKAVSFANGVPQQGAIKSLRHPDPGLDRL